MKKSVTSARSVALSIGAGGRPITISEMLRSGGIAYGDAARCLDAMREAGEVTGPVMGPSDKEIEKAWSELRGAFMCLPAAGAIKT